jgi:hypothetical protein
MTTQHIVRADASRPVTNPVWQARKILHVSDEEVTMEVAKAHCMVAHHIASVVREGPRGPRGGRGKLHYNSDPDWPSMWRPNKFHRYFIVHREIAPTKAEKLAIQYGMGDGGLTP